MIVADVMWCDVMWCGRMENIKKAAEVKEKAQAL
jgi:hypothetical protein